MVFQRGSNTAEGVRSRGRLAIDLVGMIATVVSLGVFLCLYALMWAAFFGPLVGHAVTL
jgi:hypothetical protein